MSQMSAQDQMIVKALPGNSRCADCGMKQPQWASVSFGNVFCLECSGVHRSLGVHISFVRSIAMDSWNEKQLALMKAGGNDKCNDYLKKHGIQPNTPIKQKYESPAAQLYKEVLKARVEGRPEPTQLPKPAAKPAAAAAPGGQDPNGMERLAGETEAQYVARQTRLREEARARMAAKFGNSGMGGVGSGGRMQGIGSDPHYNANAADPFGMSSLVSSFGSAMTTAGTMATDMTTSVTSSVLSQDNINTVKSTTSSFWGGLKAGVNNVAQTIVATEDPGMDGLADLQREFAAKKPTQSKYGGIGSPNAITPMGSSVGMAPTTSTLEEAQGLPGEDRNGIARLTGETDAQYVMRQTRLRDEARARMAAKFKGSTMAGIGSAPAAPQPAAVPRAPVVEATGLPGEDRNGVARLTGETDEQYVMRQTRLRDEARARMAAKFGGAGMSGVGSGAERSVPAAPSTGGAPKLTPPANPGLPKSAPSSGNAPSVVKLNTTPNMNSDDFFSNFGT